MSVVVVVVAFFFSQGFLARSPPAFWCGFCGDSQKEASLARHGLLMDRGDPTEVPHGFQVRGTCDMCLELSDVRDYPTNDGRDRQRLCKTCSEVTRAQKKAKLSSKTGVSKKICMSQPIYVSLDLRQLRNEALWREAFPLNYPVLVADVPWEKVSGNTNQRGSRFPVVTNSDLLNLASFGWAHAFKPSAKEPVGIICMWCTSDSQALALRAMNLAGYTLLHKAIWLKMMKNGTPYPFTAKGKCNIETVLFGLKGTRPTKTNMFYMERCFHGPPFMYRHSSKPLAFYTYLKHFLDQYFKGEIDYDTCNKLELFSRHATDNWTSAGNDYLGERSESGDKKREKWGEK